MTRVFWCQLFMTLALSNMSVRLSPYVKPPHYRYAAGAVYSVLEDVEENSADLIYERQNFNREDHVMWYWTAPDVVNTDRHHIKRSITGMIM